MREVYTALFPMSDKPESETREYEKSGLYPEDGSKPFRLWGFLAFLLVVIAMLAGVAVLLNFWLLPEA